MPKSSMESMMPRRLMDSSTPHRAFEVLHHHALGDFELQRALAPCRTFPAAARMSSSRLRIGELPGRQVDRDP